MLLNGFFFLSLPRKTALVSPKGLKKGATEEGAVERASRKRLPRGLHQQRSFQGGYREGFKEKATEGASSTKEFPRRIFNRFPKFDLQGMVP